MKILIKRNDQEFGPYPVDGLLQYLEQGQVLPLDLARLDTDPDTSWRPLPQLMKQHGIDSPVLARNVGTLWEDLRSLDWKLLFPWQEIRSGKWLQDKRTLFFMAVGLLPICVLLLGLPVVALRWCIAMYFAVIWSMFFFQTFHTPQIQAKTAVSCFFVTGLIAIPLLLLFVKLPIIGDIHHLSDSENLLMRFVGMFLGVGFSEELCKAGVVYFVASRPGRTLLPQTVVVYGLISGLGFGCFEGVAYQLYMNPQAPDGVRFILDILRLTSLPFLHAVWTGIAAYFISFSFVVPRKRYAMRVVAILLPAFFHGCYNTFGGIISLAAAVLSVFCFMSYLSICREMKSHLTQK